MTSSKFPFLPYGRQLIDAADIDVVCDVLKGDWLTCGPVVDHFEAALAQYVGAKFAVACSSGTAALHLAAMSLGLGEGDVVIVPAITFLATANAARYVGAEIVFSDVDPRTGLMRPADLEDAIERAKTIYSVDRIKAVLPVHLAGQCVNLPALSAICEKHGLRMVEDASHAIGTTHSNSNMTSYVGDCRFGDMTIFSFHPVKTIAMGEGGAITTNDPVLYERLRRHRNHGMVRDPEAFENKALAFDASGSPNPWYYEMPELGYNYRASDIHCALGLSQLGKIGAFAESRRRIFGRYEELLVGVDGIDMIDIVSDCWAVWHLAVVLIDFDGLERERGAVMRELYTAGIGTQVHYVPLYHQPYYRYRYGKQVLTGAEQYYRAALSIPLHPGMQIDDADRVIEELCRVLGL